MNNNPQDKEKEIALLIAAAVAAVVTDPHRIVRVDEIQPSVKWSGLMLNSWAKEGRAQHFSSHKTR